jgi:hypothetical protein
MTAIEELNRTILLCRDYVADALSDEEICRCLQSVRVLCVSDKHSLSSHSGQTALVTLVSLLSRMGMQVGLTIPDVGMLSMQPPLSGTHLRTTLIASSESLITGATVVAGSNATPDLVFVLGDTEIDVGQKPLWRLSGSDWEGSLVMHKSAASRAWSAAWPVGAMVGATLAANEAFKFAMRRLPLRNEGDRIFFEQSVSCGWDFGPAPTPSAELDLGEVDVVSAGAICQAALYVLVRFPHLRMRGRVFDDDVTDSTNLNRNMMTLATDVGRSKVQVVVRNCNRTGLRLVAIPRRFVGKDCEGGFRHRVMVGVDDIPSRWEVQRQAGGWVGVSGTSHFNISSSAHSPGAPCCGCLHPVDDAGTNLVPTISFISFWAGLAMAVRLVREVGECAYPPERQHLWLSPFRMDSPHAALWSPVAPREDCPVKCPAARAIGRSLSRGR